LAPLTILCAAGCGGKGGSAGPGLACEITYPTDGSRFDFGDSVVVKVQVTAERGEVAAVSFLVDGILRSVIEAPPYEYALDGIAYRTGRLEITAVASASGGRESADSVSVFVESEGTPVYGVSVLRTYEHDPGAFTQGLVCEGEVLYEGTGLWGQSSLRKTNLRNGRLLAYRRLPPSYFGEGIAVLGELVYQLTWRSQLAFVYEKGELDSLGVFEYEGEGWGLTTDGRNLIMSDGSSTLKFLDPAGFQVLRLLEVRDSGNPVDYLNELEYVEGEIFANLWRRDSPYRYRIARISPVDGSVTGWIELREIVDEHSSQGVLNGIAFERESRRLFLTGKNWDKLYEVEITFAAPRAAAGRRAE